MTTTNVPLRGLASLEDMRRLIMQFSATVLPIGTGPEGEAPVWGASGTFIKVGNRHAILTAHHVYDVLRRHEDFALIVRPGRHRYCIPWSEIQAVEIASPANGNYGPEGPDLAALLLSSERAGDIEARYRTFYDLDVHRREINLDLFRSDGSRVIEATTADSPLILWAVAGSPEERNDIGGLVSTVGGMIGISGYANSSRLGGYHFLDVGVAYGPETTPPESFKGVSGGGLWLVPYGRGEGGVLVWSGKAILAGVAFWQSDRQGNDRFVRCHGPLDLYGVVRDRMLDVIPGQARGAGDRP